MHDTVGRLKKQEKKDYIQYLKIFHILVIFFFIVLFAWVFVCLIDFQKQRRRRKGNNQPEVGWVRRWERSGRSWGMGKCSQNILYEKKSLNK